MESAALALEDVARLIHQETHRVGARRFVSIHCRGVREDIPERALLGLERSPELGNERPGTLFIDDVGELGAGAQDQLAKLISNQRSPAIPRDRREASGALRVVAGARRALTQTMEHGPFREDLMEALSVVQVRVPSLRERPEDIVPTARILVRERSALLGKSIRGIDPTAQRKLRAHHFPGNQRELEAVIERAVICEHGEFISEDSVTFSEGVETGVTDSLSDALGRFLDLKGRDPPSLAEVERAYIACLLARMNGNRTATARVLRVSYPTIVKKITDYKIDVPRFGRLGKRGSSTIGSAPK